MSIIEGVYDYAERSDHIAPEHVFPLTIGGGVTLAFYLDFHVFTSLLQWLDNTPVLTILAMALQGALAGIVTLYIYTVDDRSFRVSDQMKTKENAIVIVTAVTLGVGAIVGFGAPALVGYFSYGVIQLAGLVFILGIWFVHILVESWRLENEWPHFLAGGLLIIAPYL